MEDEFALVRMKFIKIENLIGFVVYIAWFVASAVLFVLSFTEFWHRVFRVICVPPYSGYTILALLICSAISLSLCVVASLRSCSRNKEPNKLFETPGLSLCNDEPTNADEFGFMQFVKMFASVLNGCAANPSETHYIGLYGKWGSGKTSIGLMVRDICKTQKSKIKFVDFKPWCKSGYASLS